VKASFSPLDSPNIYFLYKKQELMPYFDYILADEGKKVGDAKVDASFSEFSTVPAQEQLISSRNTKALSEAIAQAVSCGGASGNAVQSAVISGVQTRGCQFYWDLLLQVNHCPEAVKLHIEGLSLDSPVVYCVIYSKLARPYVALLMVENHNSKIRRPLYRPHILGINYKYISLIGFGPHSISLEWS
jgi:hypothetical protein